MNILETIVSEIVGFLGVTQAWDILKTGDYSLFRTYDGVVSLIYPIIPFLLIFELILGLIYKKPQTKVYKVNFLIYICNRFVGRFIAIAMTIFVLVFFKDMPLSNRVLPGIGLFMVILFGNWATSHIII